MKLSKALEYQKTLKLYGADLSLIGCEIFNKQKIPSGVYITVKGQRIQFRTCDSNTLLMTGPEDMKTIENFVEKFWFWEKIKVDNTN